MGGIRVVGFPFFENDFRSLLKSWASVCGRLPQGGPIENDISLSLHGTLWLWGGFMGRTGELLEVAPLDELIDLIFKFVALLHVVVIVPMKTTILQLIPQLRGCWLLHKSLFSYLEEDLHPYHVERLARSSRGAPWPCLEMLHVAPRYSLDASGSCTIRQCQGIFRSNPSDAEVIRVSGDLLELKRV
ncbi:hypothetical protein B296_00020940 [Ensete ventricosum]|uniref:Uncharacterized protein n=1 Tax=Ensete ventricosum TaxID=4639 RepID=A0A426YJH5_ENSVE|nr:hypothetical protein B296_00020940 [Ensete ventricosum]